jgi:hypothetical protein
MLILYCIIGILIGCCIIYVCETDINCEFSSSIILIGTFVVSIFWLPIMIYKIIKRIIGNERK